MVGSTFWFQALQYFLAVLVFPILSILLLAWGGSIAANETIANAVPVVFLGGVFAFVTYVCIPLVKYIPAKVDYDTLGFTVFLNGQQHRYRWEDIEKTSNHGVIGVLSFIDKQGKTVYVVHKATSGFTDFTDIVNKEIGILS